MKFKGDMTKEKFWIGWFGLHGREVGTKKDGFRRKFVDNPMDFLDHVEMCRVEHKEGKHCLPCWTTVLIYEGYNKPIAMDRVFFDFDDDSRFCPKCEKYFKKKSRSIQKISKLGLKQAHVRCKVETIVKPRKGMVADEVLRFLNHVNKGDPLIVETFKGFHVYLFMDKQYGIDGKIIKRVYDDIKRRFTQDLNLQFSDATVKKDIKQLARVPLTPHEATGIPCRIIRREKKYVNGKFAGCEFVEDEVKGLDNYLPSIDEDLVERAMKSVLQREMRDIPDEEIERYNTGQRNNNGFQGIIRPCYQERIDIGYMPHIMRLSFLIEAYFSGFTTFEQLTKFFFDWRDYKEELTSYQVRYFLDHEPDKFPPYRCLTIHKKKWCLGKKCPLFERNVTKHLNRGK